jgi:DNA (cytosine-5)-methyltransferase 1
MLRTIKEVEPTWVVGENVLGIVNWGGGVVFNDVQTDLENQGYEVQTYILPACSQNAPHRRDRVFFVAYSNKIGFSTKMENRKLARDIGFTFSNKRDAWDSFPTQPFICGGDDGLPKELDSISISKYKKESIMAYGNAIVPQVVYEIFKAIQSFEDMVNV